MNALDSNTGTPMKVVLAKTVHFALRDLAKKGEEWGPELILNQSLVDSFLNISGDTNPVHRKQEGTTRPALVPGFLLLVLLPKLSPIAEITELGGYRVINLGGAYRFVGRPVAVGRKIRLRFGVETPLVIGTRIQVALPYEIATGEAHDIVMQGTVTLALFPSKKTA